MACSDPCASRDSRRLLTVRQALDRINSNIRPINESEIVDLSTGLGRVIAEKIRSNIDIPKHRNSAMDGYAFNSRDLPTAGYSTLRVIGTSWAGNPFEDRLELGECVRIFTGAILPEQADTVVPQETVKRAGDSIEIPDTVNVGDNVRGAGTDIAAGQTVLSANKRLSAIDLGLLASIGVAKIPVLRKLRVAFFSTGDELRPIGKPLDFGASYDSNRYTLNGLLERFGADVLDMGVIPDDPDAIKQSLQDASSSNDVVITTGGASVGDADYLHQALTAVGQIDFWKIAMKPGKPLLYGTIHGSHFFGLPGNPVSVVITFLKIVLPALHTLVGMDFKPPTRIKAQTMTKLTKAPGRQEFQRGRFQKNASGEFVVTAFANQGSHILTSLSNANCLIVLPAESSVVEPGGMVDIELL